MEKDVLRVEETADFLEVDNGLVKARFTRGSTGIEQEYFARGVDAKWVPIVKSFRPPKPRPRGTAPLYDDTNVSQKYRLLTTEALNSVIAEKTDRYVRVTLSGDIRGNQIEQSISLAPGQDFFHIEVEAILTESPPRLEYLLSPFIFTGGTPPDFTHGPCIKRAPDNVLADRVFHSPAVIIQKDELFTALVPDLDILKMHIVYAKDARPFERGPTICLVPQDPMKISMPTALDLELKSGMTSAPLFSYGFMDFILEQHVYWRHENAKGALVRELSDNKLRYGMDLFVNAKAAKYRGYQRVSRFMWQRFGSRYYRQPRPQTMPFSDYAKLCYPAAFNYKGDGIWTLPSWVEFELNGKPAGGIRATPSHWYYDIQNMAWWNNVRDAVGMYWWGQRLNDSELMRKARLIINLALAAPQREGIFPAIYRLNTKRWIGCYWKPALPYDPNIVPQHWDFSSDYYQTASASKTGVHLLRYYRLCEKDPRILPYLQRYGDFLVNYIDPNGCVPAWFTRDLNPVPHLRFNGEGGIHIWFLSELYSATGEMRYLEAAEHIARFIIKEILPQQRWYDFETFYSCAAKPESTFDEHTGQWPRCTLSMIWAMDGLRALYETTGNRDYLDAGEAVADYTAFYQSIWQPHFIITAYAFGGLTSQNSDAEWLDMRQSQYAEAAVRLGKLTGRQDLLERGVAALRASFTLINHPRHIRNNIFPAARWYPHVYPLVEPENIDHEGLPELPLRSGFDWGEGGALAAAAEILRLLGGAYIDFQKKVAVGVDGVLVKSFKINGKQVCVDLENQLAALPDPYDKPYSIDLKILGLPAGQYKLIINNGSPRSVSTVDLVRGVHIEINH